MLFIHRLLQVSCACCHQLFIARHRRDATLLCTGYSLIVLLLLLLRLFAFFCIFLSPSLLSVCISCTTARKGCSYCAGYGSQQGTGFCFNSTSAPSGCPASQGTLCSSPSGLDCAVWGDGTQTYKWQCNMFIGGCSNCAGAPKELNCGQSTHNNNTADNGETQQHNQIIASSFMACICLLFVSSWFPASLCNFSGWCADTTDGAYKCRSGSSVGANIGICKSTSWCAITDAYNHTGREAKR